MHLEQVLWGGDWGSPGEVSPEPWPSEVLEPQCGSVLRDYPALPYEYLSRLNLCF